MDILAQAFIGLLTGAFGAWIASFIALRKFTAEKWWEKKAELFIRLVDCLYRLKRANEYWYLVEESKRTGYDAGVEDLNDVQRTELQQSYEEDMRELKRISELSPLLLNEQCKIKINDYLDNQRLLVEAYNSDALTTSDAHEKSYDDSVHLFDSIIEEANKEIKPKKFIDIFISVKGWVGVILSQAKS